MAFAETANLAVKLSLGGNFVSQMGKATKSLQSFDKESRAFKAGAQIGTGIKRGAIIAVAAAGTLTALLAQSVKEGQEAANVQKVYAQAISNSGKVSADYVKILNDQQKALENLGGVDDELIKSEQTRLIQMGLTGKATAALTPLILDASKATGKDLLTVTIAAGKAANGNATALQRLGIVVDKTKFKVNPLAETMRVLNQRFGGTTKALSGSLDTRLGAFRQALGDIREEAGIKLLPVLTRIVDLAGTKLVPAFGKFVDRILPEVNKGLDEFANALENGGAENAIRGITDALGPMIDLVKVAAAPVKAIVGAFLSLPKEVQTVLVGAFAVNKLTGGLVTNAAGGIAEAIGKAVLGGIKTPFVNVTAGTVSVNGGIPGGGGLPGGLPGAAAGLSTAAALGIGGVALGGGLIAAVNSPLWVKNTAINTKNENAGLTQAERAAQTYYTASSRDQSEMRKHLAFLPSLTEFASGNAKLAKAINASGGPDDRNGKTPLTGGKSIGDRDDAKAAIDKTRESVENMRGRIGDALATDTATQQAAAYAVRDQVGSSGNQTASASLSAGNNVAAAVRGIQAPITNVKVDVNVTAGGVQKTVVVQQRYGPATGSRSSMPGGYQGGAR